MPPRCPEARTPFDKAANPLLQGTRKPTASNCLLPLLLCMVTLAGCASSPLRSADRKQFAGRCYVVTGASSGIGRGVALALGQAGANVVLAARGSAALDEVAAQIEAAGGTALAVTTDVSWPADVERLARSTLLRFGHIDGWINNAGVGLIGRFEDIPVQHHARVIDVNLKGVIYGSHAALTRFREQGHGTLVNVGSVESEVPLAYQSTYAVSKHAVLALGRALNEELRLAGQKRTVVATVMPFGTDTPLYDHIANYSGHTPRSLLLDDPQKVVNVILRALLHPREEMPVGWKGRLGYHAHRLFDDLTEYLTATLYHHQQMELAPPAPATTGNLYAPSPGPGAVNGSTRVRILREDAIRDTTRPDLP